MTPKYCKILYMQLKATSLDTRYGLSHDLILHWSKVTIFYKFLCCVYAMCVQIYIKHFSNEHSKQASERPNEGKAMNISTNQFY